MTSNSPSIASARGRIVAIAGMAWLEARRTRLPWLVLGLATAALLASVFARSLTITEGARVQTAFLAAGCRFAAIFVIGLHVLASQLREGQDRVTELLLSLDLNRIEYLAGRALGHMGVAAAIAVVFWLPLAWIAPTGPGLAWLASLVLEAWVVVAAALFAATSMTQLMPAATFVFALYLLARSVSTIVLVATATPFVESGWSHELFGGVLRGLALVLPDLARFTQADWLLGHPPTAGLVAMLAVQALLYVALLLAAAAIDLYRKNF